MQVSAHWPKAECRSRAKARPTGPLPSSVAGLKTGFSPIIFLIYKSCRMPASATLLPLSFYSRETLPIARDLLGMHLVASAPPAGKSAASSRPRPTRDRATSRPIPRAAARSAPNSMFGFSRAATPTSTYISSPHTRVRGNCLYVVTAAEGVRISAIGAWSRSAGIDETTHGPGPPLRASKDRELNGTSLAAGTWPLDRAPLNLPPPGGGDSARIGADSRPGTGR